MPRITKDEFCTWLQEQAAAAPEQDRPKRLREANRSVKFVRKMDDKQFRRMLKVLGLHEECEEVVIS